MSELGEHVSEPSFAKTEIANAIIEAWNGKYTVEHPGWTSPSFPYILGQVGKATGELKRESSEYGDIGHRYHSKDEIRAILDQLTIDIDKNDFRGLSLRRKKLDNEIMDNAMEILYPPRENSQY